jgi:hypothetical protein
MPVTFNNVTINRVGLHGGRDKLLDKFPGAAAAYSLRVLNTDYKGPVVQVRESANNAEADFTAIEVADGTLAAWVGAGNNGFVKTWYDQSGNGNNASQTTLLNQPQIVASGSVILENSKPAVSFAKDFLATSSSITNAAANTAFSVLKRTANAAGEYGFTYNFAGNRNYNYESSATLNIASSTVYQSTTVLNNQILESILYASTSIYWRDGAQIKTNALTVSTSLASIYIGNFDNTASAYRYTGAIQELIYYLTDQSSNRTGIESDIASHYGITLL